MAQSSRRPAVSRSMRERLGGIAFTAPSMVLVALFFLAPLVLTVVMSFFDWPLFGRRELIGVDNYTRLAGDPSLHSSLLFTVVFTAITTAVTILLGFGLAVLISGKRSGTGALRTAFFLPVVVSMAASSFLWLWLLDPQVGPVPWLLGALGLELPRLFASQAGSVLAVVVMTTWKTVGFPMLVFLTGLQAVPVELHEAASVDGARGWQRLRYITLPLLRPTFALVLVLQVSANFLVFDQFFLMTKGGPANSTVSAVHWIYSQAFIRYDVGYGAALAVVVLLLLVGINLIQMRALRVGDDEPDRAARRSLKVTL